MRHMESLKGIDNMGRKKLGKMTEKWIALFLLALSSWVSHRAAKDSYPPREDTLFLRFQFNFMSYGFGIIAAGLLISIIIDFFEA